MGEESDLVAVRVVPRSSKNEVKVLEDGSLHVKLTAPPVEGKANRMLVEILARHFRVKKRQIEVVRGQTSRHKYIRIRE